MCAEFTYLDGGPHLRRIDLQHRWRRTSCFRDRQFPHRIYSEDLKAR